MSTNVPVSAISETVPNPASPAIKSTSINDVPESFQRFVIEREDYVLAHVISSGVPAESSRKEEIMKIIKKDWQSMPQDEKEAYRDGVQSQSPWTRFIADTQKRLGYSRKLAFLESTSAHVHSHAGCYMMWCKLTESERKSYVRAFEADMDSQNKEASMVQELKQGEDIFSSTNDLTLHEILDHTETMDQTPSLESQQSVVELDPLNQVEEEILPDLEMDQTNTEPDDVEITIKEEYQSSILS